MPEFAYPLFPNEQELVDKMRATIENAQSQALQRRHWEPEALEVFEHRLQAIVQVSSQSGILAAFALLRKLLADVVR